MIESLSAEAQDSLPEPEPRPFTSPKAVLAAWEATTEQSIQAAMVSAGLTTEQREQVMRNFRKNIRKNRPSLTGGTREQQ